MRRLLTGVVVAALLTAGTGCGLAEHAEQVEWQQKRILRDITSLQQELHRITYKLLDIQHLLRQ